MIIWQDKLLVDSVLNKGKAKDKNYWASLLTKYYIFLNSGAKDNDTIDIVKVRKYFGFFDNNKEYHSENKDKIVEYVNSLIIETDSDKKQKRVNSILKAVNSHISSITNKKTNRVFFNDKPVIIYKSEINQIQKVGKVFSRSNATTNVILQKYLFIWLVWQKAYNNQFKHAPEWCIAKDEELFKLAESERNNESGQRCNNFKKLIENEYISYSIKPYLEPREHFPQRLYKVNFIKYDGEEAFEIKDFKHIFEHYLMYNGEKYKFCETCKTLFPYTRSTRLYCDNCAR